MNIKLFYQDILFTDLLILAIQSVWLVGLVWFVARKALIKDHLSESIVLAIFTLHLVLILIDLLIGVIPYFPDSKLYLSVFEGNLSNHRSMFLYSYVIDVFRYPFLIFSPLNLIVFQKFITILSFLLVAKAAVNVNRVKGGMHDIRVQRTALIMLGCYPAVIIYTSAPLREYLAIFFVSIFLYGIVMAMNKGWAKYAPILLISIVGMYFLRFQYVVSFVGVIFAVASLSISNRHVKYILMPVFFLVLMLVLNKYLSSVGYGSITSPEEFGKLRAYFFDRYGGTGMVYGQGQFSSYLDMIIFFPTMFLQFVFAPLPILISMSNETGISTLIDGLLVTVTVGILILKYKDILRKREFKILLVVFFVMTIPVSMFEFFISSVPRHRIPSGIVLIMLLSNVLFISKPLRNH